MSKKVAKMLYPLDVDLNLNLFAYFTSSTFYPPIDIYITTLKYQINEYLMRIGKISQIS